MKPNQAEDSKLMRMVRETNRDKRMPPPPAAALNPAQLATLEKRINQGAQYLSCNDPQICDTTAVSYAVSIRNILDANCLGCHAGAGSGGITLDSYQAVQLRALNGDLLGAIFHDVHYKPMPPGSKLLPCDLAKIRTWVRAGAPNN